MNKKFIVLLLTVFFMSGCAIHYQNEKGIKATAQEIKTQFGTIEKAKANYWSKLEVWFPYKFKD